MRDRFITRPRADATIGRRATPLLVGAAAVCALVACSAEQRPLVTEQPVTPPVAETEDPRVPLYQDNRYQVSQGGRYFVWYGCDRCHGDGVPGAVDLADRLRRNGDRFADVYRYIGHGHAARAYDDAIPVEQLWQITAYVRALPELRAEMRRREAVDLTGEPSGNTWSGPLR